MQQPHLLSTRIDLKKVDMKLVQETSERLRELKRQLWGLYPERDDLIRQLVYAALLREHILIYGTFGTGKTQLAEEFFGAFLDDPNSTSVSGEPLQSFKIHLGKSTREQDLFGIPNPKDIQDSGTLKRNLEGTIVPAHIAYLDEMLDAPPYLLRELLSVLNERKYVKGTQSSKSNLHFAVATTNLDPYEAARRNPELGAFIDRLMFIAKVEYIQQRPNFTTALINYLEGARRTVTIPWQNLEYISQVVQSANLIQDRRFIAAYEDIVITYCNWAESKGIVISDRQKIRLTQQVEAHALLYGRIAVHYDDLLHGLKYGLCVVGENDQLAKFDEIAKPIVERAIAVSGQDTDAANMELLVRIQRALPQVQRGMGPNHLGALIHQLKDEKTKVEAVKPELESTETLRKQVIMEIDKRIQEAIRSI